MTSKHKLILCFLGAFTLIAVVGIIGFTSYQSNLVSEQFETERTEQIQDEKTNRVDHLFPWNK